LSFFTTFPSFITKKTRSVAMISKVPLLQGAGGLRDAEKDAPGNRRLDHIRAVVDFVTHCAASQASAPGQIGPPQFSVSPSVRMIWSRLSPDRIPSRDIECL
jgi:hypothetical protein